MGVQGERIMERFMESLILVMDDIIESAENGDDKKGRAVVVMSWGIRLRLVDVSFVITLLAIFDKLAKEYDTALVTGSGNDRADGSFSDWTLPSALMLENVPSMIVVGATDGNGRRGYFSEGFKDDPTMEKIIHAPGSEY